MLNQIILKEITKLKDIKALNIDGFIYNQELSQEKKLVFSRYKD